MGRVRLRALAIELTAACNQKCDYCYNEWREDGGAHVHTGGPERLRARVERLLGAFELSEVTLTGGEPFARPDFFDLLELVEAHVPTVKIISNGGLVTRAFAERLARHRVAFVQITLNGPDAALHEELVGGTGHFRPTLAGIRLLVEHGVPVVGCTVVTRKNAARVGETLELFRSLGVERIALSRFSPAGYAARNAAALLPSRTDLLAAFEQAAPFARDHGMKLHVTMPVPPCAVEVERFPELAFGSCPIGTSDQEFALSPDGRLRHCTLHGGALGGVPDVLDPAIDLAALVASREVKEYRRELPEFCTGCGHAATCGGGCGAAATWVFGSRRFVDPLVAQHVDDTFAAELERARAPRRMRLDVIQ
ncbi:MAG TPA: radical SAM protein [Polyangiaceae bacterium]